jgi:hypothetical protein
MLMSFSTASMSNCSTSIHWLMTLLTAIGQESSPMRLEDVNRYMRMKRDDSMQGTLSRGLKGSTEKAVPATYESAAAPAPGKGNGTCKTKERRKAAYQTYEVQVNTSGKGTEGLRQYIIMRSRSHVHAGQRLSLVIYQGRRRQSRA